VAGLKIVGRKADMMSYSWRAVLVSGWMMFGACRVQGQNTRVAEPSPAPPSSAAARDSSWLKADSAARTAELSLEVTRPAGAPSALINGSRAGQSQVIVPFSWTVTWNWRNQDSTAAHSLVVMVQREKIPLEGGRAAFTNARTNMVTEGLPAGQSDRTTFDADEAGWFWMLCGVPGHAVAGEWIELQVSREARTASLKQKTR
jgi:hypothetical protein